MSDVWKVPEPPSGTELHNGSKKIKTDDYFVSYEDLEVHRVMVMDSARTEAYRQAIQQHSHLFRDKVVLDVGAGTGVLSLMAAEAGARRVYAVEASSLHELARRVVAHNGLSDVITVLPGRVEQVQLPEQVDVLLSEWMGFYLLHESMLSSVIVARDRFLKPDGVMLPAVAELYVCPSTLASLHADRLACWRQVTGHDMSPVEQAVRHSMQTSPQIALTHPEELLAAPELVARLELLYISDEELQRFVYRRFVTVTRDGPYRGLCLWFRCLMPASPAADDCLPQLLLDTSPHAPPTHWKQTAIVLPRDFAVEAREVVGFELTLVRCQDDQEDASGDGGGGEGGAEKAARQWAISVAMLDEEAEHPVPCGCAVAKCRLIKALLDKEQAAEELALASASAG